MDKVIDISEGREIKKQGSGGGNDFDCRIRELEKNYARMETDISWIKETMATKNDMTNLKIWILGGVLGGIAIASGIAATVVKAFF